MSSTRTRLLCLAVSLMLCVPVLVVATAGARYAPAEASVVAGDGHASAAAGKTGRCNKFKKKKRRKQCQAQVSAPLVPAQTTTPTTVAPSMSSSTASLALTQTTTSTTVVPSTSSSTAPVVAPTPTAAAPTATAAPAAGSSPLTVAMRPYADIFGQGSEWSRDLSSAPVAADSAGLVANLAKQVADRYDGVASLNVWSYNVSTYTVAPGLPRTTVIWDNCQRKPYTPGQLYDPKQGAHFVGVPIPDEAKPAKGTDGELSIYDPSTDQLWEFWKATKQADGWHACWGGRIDRVSQGKGYFGDGMGVTATRLSAAQGAIGIREAQALQINHAMSLNVVEAAHWSVFSYPAQASDGQQAIGTPNAIYEGQRFRLDPTLDVTRLGLSPLGVAIARAAQKYGFVVNDKGGSVALVTESGSGAAASSGTDPWTAILGKYKSYNVLKKFPWDKLQAMPLNYGK